VKAQTAVPYSLTPAEPAVQIPPRPGTPIPATSGRLPSLDGLRAFSIALVVIGHAASADHSFSKSGLSTRLTLSVLGNGHFGVQVFFVISGFIITHLLTKERARDGNIDLRHFYIRRFFRICPAYYTLIAVVAILSSFGVLDATRRDVGHAATFTWLYNFGKWNWYLAHSWSLSVEEQFYLFWPAVLLIFGPKRSVWIALTIIAVTPMARYGLILPGSKLIHRICYVLTAGQFDVLMFGCLAALLWPSERFRSLLMRPDTAWMCSVLGVTAFVLSSVAALIPSLAEKVVFAVFLDSLIGLGVCAVVMVAVSRPNLIGYSILNFRGVVWIGTLSYSVYLWQQLFLTPRPAYSIQRFPLNIVLAFGAGAASFYFLERPAIRFRVRVFRDRAPSGPAI
jgi:peptidoglycan/LPS O-acetylase OafA/YrhL